MTKNENVIAIYIILPNALKERLLARLKSNNFKCTFLSTHGAYLRAGQTTVLTITERENLSKLSMIIEETKKYHNANYAEKVKDVLMFSVPVIDFRMI